jgi:hypothetical protein
MACAPASAPERGGDTPAGAAGDALRVGERRALGDALRERDGERAGVGDRRRRSPLLLRVRRRGGVLERERERRRRSRERERLRRRSSRRPPAPPPPPAPPRPGPSSRCLIWSGFFLPSRDRHTLSSRPPNMVRSRR